MNFKTICLVLFTYVSFRMNLALPSETLTFPSSLLLNIIYSFRKFEVKDLVLLAGLWFIFSRTAQYLPKTKKTCVFLPAALFAFFMVFGFSFEATDSWNLALGLRNGQILKALFIFIRWFLIFYYLIGALYAAIDSYLSGLSKKRAVKAQARSTHLLSDPCFRTSFLILLIGYLPRMIVAYPATVMADSVNQICQAFPELHYVRLVFESKLLSPDIFINQHHPVAHTLLVHYCLVFGDRMFHSFNAGAFLYAVLQNLLFFFTVAVVIAFLCRKMSLDRRTASLLSAYLVFHPLIHNYISLITKDIFYLCFLLLFSLCLFLFPEIKKTRESRAFHILLAVSCAGAAMFRNEARYIVVLCLLCVCLLYKSLRKTAIIHLGAFLVFSFLYFHVLMNALHFTPGSVREMLSVPFQQTARYVKYNEEDISQEEKEAISRVLDYDSLEESYDPDLADPVKDHFNQDASGEELSGYFHAWLTGLCKRPGTYIQATMNNYYQFFYPGNKRASRYTLSWSDKQMGRLNRYLEPIGKQFHVPERLAGLRAVSDKAGDLSGSFPVFSVLMTPAFYTWSYLLMAFYSLRTGNRCQFLVLVPTLASQLFFILGPANGYYGRYSFPAAVLIPFTVLMFVCAGTQKSEQ